MEKVILGDLIVMRETWVREAINLDHVRQLINSLVLGKKLPPLLVERNTKIIVGGSHRFVAYKQFFGDGWENREVEVKNIDLPPYQDDPVAWMIAGLKDNPHNALRLDYRDRHRVAARILDVLKDPEAEAAKEVARLLTFTPATWNDFSQTYLAQIATFSTPAAPGRAQESNKPARQALPRPDKDTSPADVTERNLMSPRAELQSKGEAVIRLIARLEGALTDQDRKLLARLAKAINNILQVSA